MEASSSPHQVELIDLTALEAGERASAWTHAVPSFFAGMSVLRVDHRPVNGLVTQIAMGGSSLWSVRSPPATVSYAPSHDGMQAVSLLMQGAGRTGVTQQRRSCELGTGDICVLDEQFAFTMDCEGGGEFVFLRMPRLPVLNRNPQLEHQTAITLLSTEPAVGLVGQTLSAMLLAAPFMRESQRRCAVSAMIEMLGAIETRSEGGSAWHRVQAALSFIELNFATHGLGAEDVAKAQWISRRRLDQLLRETIGLTITGQIWKRRLNQAAADLMDPARVKLTASQIAFANGFEDAAHFTRAFKRSYGHSPVRWRNLGQRVQ